MINKHRQSVFKGQHILQTVSVQRYAKKVESVNKEPQDMPK